LNEGVPVVEKNIQALITASEALEKKVATLYRLLSRIFPENEMFWFGLADEEERHAAIISSGSEYLLEAGLFPLAALDPDFENIQNTSDSIEGTIKQYAVVSPTLLDALIRAIEIELSSSELFYQFALDLPFNSAPLKFLRTMTGENKNHILKLLDRIKAIKA
jgi:hypothetical protein